MSPGPAKPQMPALPEALAELDRLQARVAAAERDVSATVADRAIAIRRALELGATLRSLGGRLGVSPETVRKMATQ